MVKLFYTTYISVDLAHHEIYRAKGGKGGIKPFLAHRIRISEILPCDRISLTQDVK